MSRAESESQHGVPIQKIHRSYQRCLQARQQFVDVRPAGPSARGAAQHDLHTAVGDYYETLRAVVKASGKGEDFWRGTEEHHLWANPVQVVPTEDGEVPLSKMPEEKVDTELLKEVRTRVEYVGLGELENEWARVEQEEQSFSDATGSHSTTVQKAEPLSVDILFVAARKLDELATELGFLVTPGITTETDPEPV